jgi:hypothetical protein
MMNHTRNVIVLYGYATPGAVAGRSRTDSTREVDFIVALGRLAGNISRAL